MFQQGMCDGHKHEQFMVYIEQVLIDGWMDVSSCFVMKWIDHIESNFSSRSQGLTLQIHIHMYILSLLALVCVNS